MQSYTSFQKWNKKAGIVTALVAIVGMASILYTASNFANEQFVSAVTSSNPFKSETIADIYPWDDQSTLNSETLDFVSHLIQTRNKISEIDTLMVEDIKNGIHDAVLFEQKGDLLVSIGQYGAAIPFFEESLDIEYQEDVERKLLKAKAMIDRMNRIQVN
ncbi:hypothetical protein [Nitrosopumilus sp. S6]